MVRQESSDNKLKQRTAAPDSDREADLGRREALVRLSRYAAAGYVAPAFLTLMVSKKASAASGDPPPPPG